MQCSSKVNIGPLSMSRLLQQGIKMPSSLKPQGPQLTHFLCIPLVTSTSRPQLSTSLASFKDDVTGPKDLGGFELSAEAVRPVGTLHLTLGMMSFPNDDGLGKAVAMLESLKPRGILAAIKKPVLSEAANQAAESSTSQFLITLQGLNSMQKPDRATVLYAPPLDQEGALQEFGEKIKATFKDAGLLVPDKRPLLLHATIVNTIYVRGNKHGSKSKNWDRNVIRDAQAMLDRYEDQVWMRDMPLEKIAICRMRAKPVEEAGVVVDAAYEVEAEIAL